LKEGHKRGLNFNPERAYRVIKFLGLLKQSKGKWAGEPLVLEPWQKFVIWVLYGWEKDGVRRFRTAYSEIARKNGKSTLLSGLGLYGLGFDGEGGAEIYSVATKEAQAKITFTEGQRMVRKSNYLGGLAKSHVKSISIDSKESFWKPLGKDSKTEDGLNPHMVMVDEYHAHPDASMLEVMDSALGSRTNPLLFIITTAGFNSECACKEERDYAINVLKGVIHDDTYFGIVFTLDDGDDWKDEKVWMKANPNLGVTVSLDDMQRMCKKAIESPSRKNNFLTKKLNIWTNAEVNWINLDLWNACNKVIDEKDLHGKPCHAGLDLSSVKDLTCWGLWFILDDGDEVFLPRFFLPKDNLDDRKRHDKVPYHAWSDAGYINFTPGNVVDYEHVEAQIVKDFKDFDIQLMAVDRWAFEARKQRLNAIGVPEEKIISFGQGYASMSEPMKEFEKTYLSGKFIHNNNPVLRWMASCVEAKTDGADNIKPVKPDRNKSGKRIDGIVSAIMAKGISMTQEVHGPSVYESRGAISLC
jgi:phage terminase large subunit-like protein